MRPEVGELIRVQDGDREHICTVTDLLNTQLAATYESARADGGWREHTLFCFYGDVEWSAALRQWVGKRG